MNKAGQDFIETIRDIIQSVQESCPKEKWARLAAFEIVMMLDDTGEFGDGKQKFKVVTMDGKPVKFYHHDL